LQEDPLTSIYVHHSTDNGGTLFKNLNKQSTNVLSLNRLEKRSSLRKVIVNDYGAEGNGDNDDSEVLDYSLGPKQSFSSFLLACTVSISLAFHNWKNDVIIFLIGYVGYFRLSRRLGMWYVLLGKQFLWCLRRIICSNQSDSLALANLTLKSRLLTLKITLVINYSSFFMLHL